MKPPMERRGRKAPCASPLIRQPGEALRVPSRASLQVSCRSHAGLRAERVHAFLSASGLWAASFPDLSLFTRYSGLSLEAATLWPLICVGLVCFFTTVPVLWPPEESQDTL